MRRCMITVLLCLGLVCTVHHQESGAAPKHAASAPEKVAGDLVLTCGSYLQHARRLPRSSAEQGDDLELLTGALRRLDELKRTASSNAEAYERRCSGGRSKGATRDEEEIRVLTLTGKSALAAGDDYRLAHQSALDNLSEARSQLTGLKIAAFELSPNFHACVGLLQQARDELEKDYTDWLASTDQRMAKCGKRPGSPALAGRQALP